MNIFLIGMPGSGKTTVSNLLAKQLGFQAYDTDELIKAGQKKSISEIFASDGEEYFRCLEHDLLCHWPYFNCVVATGGGMPCFYDNLDLMHYNGKTVYLEASTTAIINRLRGDSTRPLLIGKNDIQLIKWVEETLQQRKPYYEHNTLTVDANQSAEDVVNAILKHMPELKDEC